MMLNEDYEFEVLNQARRSGFLCRKALHAEDEGPSNSWFGGSPRLPAHFEWPHSEPHSGDPAIPLHFVAQIDLKQVPTSDHGPSLPREGTLFFFADPIFGPVKEFTANGAAVLYVPEDVSHVPLREMPGTLPSVEDISGGSYAYMSEPTNKYRRWAFTFEPSFHFNRHLFHDPDMEDPELESMAADVASVERDRLKQLLNGDVEQAEPHYKGGLNDPTPHFILTGASAPGVNEGGSGVEYLNDLIPLLVIRDDSDIGFNFGVQLVAFWISPEDLENRDFQKAWALAGIS